MFMTYPSNFPDMDGDESCGRKNVPDECAICGSSVVACLGDEIAEMGEFARSKSRGEAVRAAVFSCGECGVTYALSV